MSGEHLRMYLPLLEHSPLPESVAGYTIRRLIPGEERTWWQLLNETRELGTWDEKRAKEEFSASSGRVWKDSIHFAVFDDRVVGTACVQLHAEREDVPELGWVAVSEDHRGRGLGRILCLHIVSFMRDSGFQHCFVQTRPHREAAVRLFRNLGFEPQGDSDDRSLSAFLGTLPRRPRPETQTSG